ncbi:RHS repeat-associated core domain-containing protein [Bordetella bronchialis]|uniref:RHS repeat-associated core domain-containing protein n=1 Tax=Bordetella bronchialis TaxID=463025 RepID=A0ABN4R5U2_9BORD|nr:RHS repeat-associated core domain-containing protein [Bordetella bronchialis]ANN66334.1 hypothetical protein BAU06_08580 [Bordetella bronchialis]
MTGESNLRYGGYRDDRVTAGYALGNGHRLYLPSLMRFTSPDGMSPFGAGRIHSYAYCAGDPVNHADPGGTMAVAILAAVMAVGDVVSALRGASRLRSVVRESRAAGGWTGRTIGLAALHGISTATGATGAVVGFIGAPAGLAAPSATSNALFWATMGLTAVSGASTMASLTVEGTGRPRSANPGRPEIAGGTAQTRRPPLARLPLEQHEMGALPDDGRIRTISHWERLWRSSTPYGEASPPSPLSPPVSPSYDEAMRVGMEAGIVIVPAPPRYTEFDRQFPYLAPVGDAPPLYEPLPPASVSGGPPDTEAPPE